MNIGRNLALGLMLTGAAACDDENKPATEEAESVPLPNSAKIGTIGVVGIDFIDVSEEVDGIIMTTEKRVADIFIILSVTGTPDLYNHSMTTIMCDYDGVCETTSWPIAENLKEENFMPDGGRSGVLVSSQIFLPHDGDLLQAKIILNDSEGLPADEVEGEIDLDPAPLPDVPEIPDN